MKLNHPVLADISVDVSEADVTDWVASGWVLDGPFPVVLQVPATKRRTRRPKQTNSKLELPKD